MKKTIALFSLAALLLTASPALAYKGGNDDNDRGRGKHFGWFMGRHNRLADTEFALTGTVVSTTATSITTNVSESEHLGNIVNDQSTVVINAQTVIKNKDNTTLAVSDLVAGNKIVIFGTISGSVYTATKVQSMEKIVKKAVGKVTSKTSNSVTITNGVTNLAQTITTDSETKVSINGETKTIADINVGDSGWIKFKNVAGTMVAKVINLFR